MTQRPDRLIPTTQPPPGQPLGAFNGHDYPTLGIELELLLCRRSDVDTASTVRDPVTGRVLTAFDAVVARLPASTGNPSHPLRVDKELFTNTCEVTTGIHSTVESAQRELTNSIAEVRRACSELGLFPISVGAHPFAVARDQTLTAHPRIRSSVQALGKPARDMQTTGLHVHVAVPDGDTAVRVADVLARLAPLFIALSASSPYWEGEDTSYQSYRTLVFRAVPMTGLPAQARTFNEYTMWYDTLRRVGRVTSHKDVHTDVRPSPGYGTVELRVCDAPPTLSEVASIAALCQCLVTQLAFPELAQPGMALPAPLLALRRELMEDNVRSAARLGLAGAIVIDNHGTTVGTADTVRHLVRVLMPVAERLGCATELAGVIDIVEHGPSASRQRAQVAAGSTLEDVVESLGEELASNRTVVAPSAKTTAPRRSPPRALGEMS